MIIAPDHLVLRLVSTNAPRMQIFGRLRSPFFALVFLHQPTKVSISIATDISKWLLERNHYLMIKMIALIISALLISASTIPRNII